MTATPLLFLAALPSGDRSIPRCLAIAAETGVISKSPRATLLKDSLILSVMAVAIINSMYEAHVVYALNSSIEKCSWCITVMVITL